MAIVSSKGQKPAHLKILFWGDTSTRKTETILRNFPDVLIIDTEGNAEQCFTVPEIPEFLIERTKDIEQVIRTIDDVAAGRVRFPDGRAVQTLAIDSMSVLWTIRKDARAIVAEGRAKRWGKSAEDASMTQLDWSMAKRPILRLLTRLANCPIRFVVMTARQNDKFDDDPNKKGEVVKVGQKADAIKGIEYDLNLVMQFGTGQPWGCTVTKVQGALGRTMPVGKQYKEFPAAEIIGYAGAIVPQARNDKGDDELAESAADSESRAEAVKVERVQQAAETQAVDVGAQFKAAMHEIGATAADVARILGDEKPSAWLARDGHTVDQLKSLVLDGMTATSEVG